MNRKRFARFIREHRMALKPRLTQAALSELLGVSQEAVSKWERQGVDTLPPEMIRQIARVFGVDAHEVAAALGYPVNPEPVAARGANDGPGNDDPVVLTDRIAALVRQQELLQARFDQAMERLLEERGPEPGLRSGGTG